MGHGSHAGEVSGQHQHSLHTPHGGKSSPDTVSEDTKGKQKPKSWMEADTVPNCPPSMMLHTPQLATHSTPSRQLPAYSCASSCTCVHRLSAEQVPRVRFVLPTELIQVLPRFCDCVSALPWKGLQIPAGLSLCTTSLY